MGKASDVPSNVFGGSAASSNVYDKLCQALTLNSTNGLPMQTDLTWAFDPTGNKTPNPASIATRSLSQDRDLRSRVFAKRSPPPNPASYTNDRFVLKWKPGDFMKNKCNRECKTSLPPGVREPS